MTRLEVRPVDVYSAPNTSGPRLPLCPGLPRRVAPAPAPGPDSVRRTRSRGRKSKTDVFCAEAKVSDSAEQKADTRFTPDGLPANSIRTLPDHLGSLTLNQIALTGNPEHTFNVATEPTPLQQRAFQLLGLDPTRMFPVNV